MGVVALDADDDVEELYAVFGRHAIRRVPVSTTTEWSA